MKAEHRKELQTNLLADRMGRLLESVKAGPRSTSLAVWILVGLVLIVLVTWYVYSGSSAKDRSALWAQLDDAMQNPLEMSKKLSEVVERGRGTIPARVARFQLARRSLHEGVRELPSEIFRKEAIDKLEGARTEFARLAGECIDDPVLGPEALMNLARAEEILYGVVKEKADGSTWDPIMDLTVEQKHEGLRLNQYLVSMLPGYSRFVVARAIDAGVIDGSLTVNGKPAKAGYKLVVHRDDQIRIWLPEPIRGDPDQALEYYEQLVEKYPSSAAAKEARQRAELLRDESKRGDVEQLYARLRDEFRRKLPDFPKPDFPKSDPPKEEK